MSHPILPSLMEKLGRIPDAPGVPAATEFLGNAGDFYRLAPNEWFGEPRATAGMTVETLKADGIRGIYRKAQHS